MFNIKSHNFNLFTILDNIWFNDKLISFMIVFTVKPIKLTTMLQWQEPKYQITCSIIMKQIKGVYIILSTYSLNSFQSNLDKVYLQYKYS